MNQPEPNSRKRPPIAAVLTVAAVLLLQATAITYAAPATAPQQPSAKVLRNRIRLNWQNPTSQTESLTHVRIEYREQGESSWTFLKRVTYRPRFFHHAGNWGPDHNTTYQYRIGALRNGSSTVNADAWSDTVTVTVKYTKQNIHAPSAHLYYDGYGHNSDDIYLRIRQPAVHTGTIDSYEIEWRQWGAAFPTAWTYFSHIVDPYAGWMWRYVSSHLRGCYDTQFRVLAVYAGAATHGEGEET